MKCIPKNAVPVSPSDEAWVAVAAGDLPQWGKVWMKAGPSGEGATPGIAEVVGALAVAARQGEIDGAGIEVLGALMAEGLGVEGVGYHQASLRARVAE
jgi:hypothetical protein